MSLRELSSPTSASVSPPGDGSFEELVDRLSLGLGSSLPAHTNSAQQNSLRPAGPWPMSAWARPYE